jgi:hypothetical protein
MALWRDPYDELIDELERALPVATNARADQDLPRLADIQRAVQIILKAPPGTDPCSDPLVRQVKEQIAHRLERSKPAALYGSSGNAEQTRFRS